MDDTVATRPRMDKIPGTGFYHLAFLIRLFLAESLGLGTVLFVLVLLPSTSTVPGPIVAGAVFTFVIGIFGPISGAQVNPAVSIALLLTRRLSTVHALVCIAGQLVGATVGTWFAKVLGPASLSEIPNLGMTMPIPEITTVQTIGLEICATAILVITVLSVSDEFRSKPWTQGHVTIFPLFFGVMLLMLASFIGPYTGASMNPARSLGPAFINGVYTDQWIYVVAPLCGCIIATILYEGLLTDGASIDRFKAWFSASDFDRTVNYKHLKRQESQQF